ncbi:MAG: anti-sigma factor antagonist [Phycisphaerae bacterium]|nr:anti-sigma factor antagonist [Phycisphaerae bacterium]
MAILSLSENVLLVTLPAEPQSTEDLERVMRLTRARSDCDVIVDFSLAEILSSATLCNLLIMERQLSMTGHQLTLCSVPSSIMGVFTRVGLHKLFRFAEDEFAALQSLEPERQTSA